MIFCAKHNVSISSAAAVFTGVAWFNRAVCWKQGVALFLSSLLWSPPSPPCHFLPVPLELTLNYLMCSGNWLAELIGSDDRHFLCTLGIEYIFLWFLANRQIEILELGDLEKECSLARIRLTLAQHDPSAVAVAGSHTAVWGHRQQARHGVLDQHARRAKHLFLLLGETCPQRLLQVTGRHHLPLNNSFWFPQEVHQQRRWSLSWFRLAFLTLPYLSVRPLSSP